MGIARGVLLWSAQNRWIENQFRRRRFAQKAVSRFMPGEDVDAALIEAKKLGERNISAVVTQLGENLASIGEADQVAAHYVSVLDKVNGLGINCHVSVKLTQLGLDIDPKQTARTWRPWCAMRRPATTSSGSTWRGPTTSTPR